MTVTIPTLAWVLPLTAVVLLLWRWLWMRMWDRYVTHCQTCGGDGFEFCEDTDSAEGCWVGDCDGEVHTCPNCRGSGRAKDQWFW